MPLLFCKTGNALRAELFAKSQALAFAAARMAKLAAQATGVTARPTADIAAFHNQCNSLFDELKEAHRKLTVHRAEHGC